MARPSNRLSRGVRRIRRRLQRPILSVVIPAYNAEDTIERAIRSALNQGVDNIEVIVVDDESTDDTRLVVSSLAQRDRRVKLLATGTNSGPGRARNQGVAAAKGRFVTFIDADDRALPNAYKRMLRTIQRTGSQFISGRYVRDGSAGVTSTALSQRVHREERLATNLTAFPEILEEPVLWNKIYDTEFWRRAVGEIPEDRNYEDQEPAIRAASGATTFDVVDYDVYAWSLPDGKSSRSQSKATIEDLKSRALVVGELIALTDAMPPRAANLMRQTILGRDLPMYIELVPYTSDEYWEELQSLTRRIYTQTPVDSITSIPFRERVFAYLGAYGTREDIETFVGATVEFGKNPSWQQEPSGHWAAHAPYFDEFSRPIPWTIRRLGPNDWKVRSSVWSAYWNNEGSLELQGYAYVPGLETSAWSHRAITLISEAGDVLWSQRLPTKASEWVDVEANDALTTYVDSAFAASVPPPPESGRTCTVEITITVGARRVRSTLEYPVSEVSRQKQYRGQTSTCAEKGKREELTLQTEALPHEASGSPTSRDRSNMELTSVTVSGNIVELAGSLPVPRSTGAVPTTQLALIGSGFEIELPVMVRNGKHWTARLDLSCPTVPSAGMFLRWRYSSMPPQPENDGATRPNWHYVAPVRAIAPSCPVLLQGRARALTIARFHGSSVGLTPGPPLTEKEKSRNWRRGMSESQFPPLRDAVVFDSFTGKTPTDNPLGVLEQMDSGTLDAELSSALPKDFESWPRYWSVVDGTIPVPEGVEPIYEGTRRWFDVIRSARLLVTNNHLPQYFVKSPGQFWLQTWHGTPLKLLLFDAPRNATSAQYRRLMTQQVADWDLLLAQDHQAGENLSAAMGYSGPIIVAEYPRNSRLFVSGLRELTRKRLGIPDGKHVILYAPTWQQNTDREHPKSHVLDPVALAKQTGALMLVRAHHMTPTRVANDTNIIDVSEEPRIEDLMVASDALISDYSSIFFDYALLDRPMYSTALSEIPSTGTERRLYRLWPEGTRVIVVEPPSGPLPDLP